MNFLKDLPLKILDLCAIFLILVCLVFAGLIGMHMSAGPVEAGSISVRAEGSFRSLDVYTFSAPGTDKTCVYVKGYKQGGLSCFDE